MWTYETLLPGLEISELERGTLETCENPEILEGSKEVNAVEVIDEKLKPQTIVSTDPYILGGFLELNVAKL